ncbi:hypothetical protein CRENBAI_010630 [Crenichthys baileyi]|uniref:Uncharacterized protein n=1 Tax=Crenichthys baileyi TaxID=28760 RepID=A0AAV9S0M7_9TELE
MTISKYVAAAFFLPHPAHQNPTIELQSQSHSSYSLHPAPPPHSAPQQQGKGPAEHHPRPLAQQGRPRRAPHPQQDPRPRSMTGQTHPPDPRGQCPHHAPTMPHSATKKHSCQHSCHCNCPGRNTIQLSSTIATQLIQTPVE